MPSDRSLHTLASWRRTEPVNQSLEIGELAVINSKPTGSTIVNQQQHFNEDVVGHPLLVIGQRMNGTTSISTCLQVTTFGGRTIHEKYHDGSQTSIMLKNQYVPINHTNTTTHCGLPILSLANGQRLRKQSYVHLDQFLEIETKDLLQYGNRLQQLDAPSIAKLERVFVDFITGVIRRPYFAQNNQTLLQSPLDYPRLINVTPGRLGVKDYRSNNNQMRDLATSMANTTISPIRPALLRPMRGEPTVPIEADPSPPRDAPVLTPSPPRDTSILRPRTLLVRRTRNDRPRETIASRRPRVAS